MNRDKILNTIGFSLLGLCFLFALWNVAFRTVRELEPGVVTIRFAHWQLEGGLRSTFDILSREYEKICAARGLKVRVEQQAIPERVFPNWLVTQLVGGKAPQIIAIDNITSGSGMSPKGMTTDRIARYFEAISARVHEPNPYNIGTPLEGVPWCDTFVDGMSRSYDSNLLDYYSVPLSMYTFRLFYNKPLYREIFGDAPPPTEYREFLKACATITAYGRARGLNLVPIAGSKYNAPMLTDYFAGTQTQKLGRRLNRFNTLVSNDSEVMLAYLRGEWNVRSPEITASLRLLQSINRNFQPGFQQVDRDSATFYFVQERCVFVSAGSWDNTSLRIQAPFDLGVCHIPVPAVSDPDYGRFMYGPPTEAANGTALAFGLVRGAARSDLALDFLHYLSSYHGNALFSKHSGWLPSVIKVPVDETLEVFEPVIDGYPNAFGLGMGTETSRLRDNDYYLLQAFPDSPQKFQDVFERNGYGKACIGDLTSWQTRVLRIVTRQDTLLAAYYERSRDRKFYELIEQQIQQEQSAYMVDSELSTLTKENQWQR
ncbi:MAG: extracellular solute-binding protein [Verrucomicrobiales bacterium]|jgi:raffinose/stachyose/melibiose transport system substrate-binding protein|nr:extracellular solute-binding protein [Verrucomicrobiales bacterium]